jgi:hypothetical protein
MLQSVPIIFYSGLAINNVRPFHTPKAGDPRPTTAHHAQVVVPQIPLQMLVANVEALVLTNRDIRSSHHASLDTTITSVKLLELCETLTQGNRRYKHPSSSSGSDLTASQSTIRRATGYQVITGNQKADDHFFLLNTASFSYGVKIKPSFFKHQFQFI